ncbi:MAG: HEAT repeat domain-containing protein [Candidatus Saganbacteria bacterium]|nr:HEAT repeat domain-containing protein [Candidatus Saganbacteria bacterium]
MGVINNCNIDATNRLFPSLNKNYKDKDESCSIDAITAKKKQKDIRYRILSRLEQNKYVKEGLKKIGRNGITGEGYGNPQKCHPLDINCDRKICEKEGWIAYLSNNDSSKKFLLLELNKIKNFNDKKTFLDKIANLARENKKALSNLLAASLQEGIDKKDKELILYVLNYLWGSTKNHKGIHPLCIMVGKNVSGLTNDKVKPILEKILDDKTRNKDKRKEKEKDFPYAFVKVVVAVLGRIDAEQMFPDDNFHSSANINRTNIAAAIGFLLIRNKEFVNETDIHHSYLKNQLGRYSGSDKFKNEICRGFYEIGDKKSIGALRTVLSNSNSFSVCLTAVNYLLSLKAFRDDREKKEWQAYQMISARDQKGLIKLRDWAIPALRNAIFEENDEEVIKLAAETLGKIGSDQAVYNLSAPLYRLNNYKHGKLLVAALGATKSPKAIRALAEELRTKDLMIPSLEALYMLNLPEKTIPILKETKDQHPFVNVRAQAAEILIRLKQYRNNEEKEELNSFNLIAKNKWKEVRKNKTIAIPALISACLYDQDTNVRNQAAYTLKLIDIQKTNTLLLSTIKNNKYSFEIMIKATKALAVISDKKNILPLIRIFNKSKSDYFKAEIVRTLGFTGGPIVERFLKKAIRNKRLIIRQAAVSAFVLKITPQKIQTLRNFLNDPNARIRGTAARALMRLKLYKKPALMAHVMIDSITFPNSKKGDDDTKIWEKIEKLGNPALPALILTVKDGPTHVHEENAARILGLIGNPKACPALGYALLSNREEKVRKMAAWALGKIRSSSAVTSLHKAWDLEKHHATKKMILEALTITLRGDKKIFFLTKVLREEQNAHLRAKAAQLLLRINPALDSKTKQFLEAYSLIAGNKHYKWKRLEKIGSQAIPALSAFLLQKNPCNTDNNYSCGEKFNENRQQAIVLLGKTKDQKALKALFFVLKNDFPVELEISAVESIGNLNQPYAALILIKHLNSDYYKLTIKILKILRCLGNSDPKTIRALNNLIKSSSSEIRAEAAETLLKFNAYTSTTQARTLKLHILLANKKPDKWIEIFRFAETAVPVLNFALLNDDNYTIRSDCARALGWIKDKRSLKYLLRASRTDNTNVVRVAAAKALGYFGDKRAIPALRRSLKGRYVQVRSAAAFGLLKLKDYKNIAQKEVLKAHLLIGSKNKKRWKKLKKLGKNALPVLKRFRDELGHWNDDRPIVQNLIETIEKEKK